MAQEYSPEDRLLFCEVGIEAMSQILSERGVVTQEEFWSRMNVILKGLNEQAEQDGQAEKPDSTDSTDKPSRPPARRRTRRK